MTPGDRPGGGEGYLQAAAETSSRAEATAPRLSVVVPTRDEAGNLGRLSWELEAALEEVSHEVIVVDDSTDGETRPLLRELVSGSHHWRLIERPPDRQTGLATAVVEGMDVARGDAVCVMDADLQHPPTLVTRLLAAVESGTDLAVASRYTRGGGSEGLAGIHRHLISGLSRLLAHMLLPESRRTADPLSGFFCARRSAVNGFRLQPVGFKILLELLVVCPHLLVLDIPFVFGRRPAGASKADTRQGLLYLKHLALLAIRVPHSSLRKKLVLISLLCLAGFTVCFDLLSLVIGPLTLAWLAASLATVVASAAWQRTMTRRAVGAGSALSMSLGLAGLPAGLLLYDDLLRLHPGNPVGVGTLAQSVVLALPLAIALIGAARPRAARTASLRPEAAPYYRPDPPAALGGRPGAEGSVSCSVGIMAFNEEANIGPAVRAVLAQGTPSVRIEEVIVVASGCTDRTEAIVAEIAQQEPRVRLCVQEKREGKASAVNLFLKQASSPVVVLSGADVIPETSAFSYLCEPLMDPQVGMVGGRPVPVNDPYTFMGHAVHVLWRLHHYVAQTRPKLGELVAFRNVISGIPANTSVDEISIQALISQLGYRLMYEPACVVYNKGPVTVQDFVKQRRRIYAGHLQIRHQQKYDAPTMKVGPILEQLIACRHFTLSSPRRVLWTAGTVILEGLARIQGYVDYRRKQAHHIWHMVESTKDLQAGTQRPRGMGNEQSVLVFRLIPGGGEEFDAYPETRDRQATDAARKLLPVVRARIRKEDKLSISGPGIMTAVIRVQQQEADRVARDIQEVVQATPVHLGIRGREVRVAVAYSVLTFAFKATRGDVTVAGPLIREALGAAGPE
jgi:glycosyltransferase involved in cell wall biosynthesis